MVARARMVEQELVLLLGSCHSPLDGGRSRSDKRKLYLFYVLRTFKPAWLKPFWLKLRLKGLVLGISYQHFFV